MDGIPLVAYLPGVCDLLDVAAGAGVADGGQGRRPVLVRASEPGQIVYQLLAGHFYVFIKFV